MPRAPHASATFNVGNLSASKAVAGAKLVLTGRDFTAKARFPASRRCPPPTVRHGAAAYPTLPETTVHHGGDGIALIVMDKPPRAFQALRSRA